jgi:hypothetical protein
MTAAGGAELSGFLEAAGRSLGEAQSQLLQGAPGAEGAADAGGAAAVAISDIEIEVKATIGKNGEQLELQPVSSKDARRGTIDPNLLSSLRVRFVALPDFGASTE